VQNGKQHHNQSNKRRNERFFDGNNACSVRYFKEIGDETFQATIRHAQLKHHLSGTYTIPQIIKTLNAREKLQPRTKEIR